MDVRAILRLLGSELAAPAYVAYTVSPCGRRVAVLEWSAYPPRQQAPTLLLGYGTFVYDATRRASPRLVLRTGRLTVLDTGTGERLAEPADRVSGPPVWSPDGRWLAGLAPVDADGGYGVWVWEVDSGVRTAVDGLRVGCSLLGAVPGRRGARCGTADGPPLWWTPAVGLLVTRDSIDHAAIDPRDDIVAEPELDPHGVRAGQGEEIRYHHDLLAIAAAARVDLVLVDPRTSGSTVVTEGCVVADCQVQPEGGRVLVGVAHGAGEVAALLGEGVIGYEIYDLEQDDPVRHVGSRPVGEMSWRPGSRYDVEGDSLGVTGELPRPAPGAEVHGVGGQEPASGSGGRVVFADRAAVLLERHEEAGWSLVRRSTDRADDELVVHHLPIPRPTLGQWVYDPALEGRREQAGRLTPYAAYRLCLPWPWPEYERGAAGSAFPVLVDVRPLTGDGPVPVPRPLQARMFPVLTRTHLAAGHAVATLYVRLPSGSSVRFDEICDRLTGAVTALHTELAGTDHMDPASVDAGRLALSGHSFGAACAAVALAHTHGLFDCAILRAGAYNRTLTPRGFQDEQRSLWQARDVYDGFTLAYHAPAIDCPVLILQGGADTNGVTDALQAWAFYDALLAAGGMARLVLLYNEGHNFATREGLLTAAREELTWMGRWTPTSPPS